MKKSSRLTNNLLELKLEVSQQTLICWLYNAMVEELHILSPLSVPLFINHNKTSETLIYYNIRFEILFFVDLIFNGYKLNPIIQVNIKQ